MAPPSASDDTTAAHHPPQPPPHGGNSSTTNSNNTSTGEQDQEHSKPHQNHSPTVNEDDTATTAAANATTTATITPSIPGTEGDISVLSLLYEFYSTTGRHPTASKVDMNDFYEYWIKLRLPGVYNDKEALEIKINELHSRFLWNMRKDVDIPKGPINTNILQLCSYIWHDEIDPIVEEIMPDDHDQECKDSSHESSRISGNESIDSS